MTHDQTRVLQIADQGDLLAAEASVRGRWDEHVLSLGAEGPGRALLERLIAAWSEPHRRYHTLQHLQECLELLERWNYGPSRHDIAMALWFHDAVYDTRASDNEERSARWAESVLCELGVPATTTARVRDLVLATAHMTTRPGTVNESILVDIDLSILGAAPLRFAQYERQVRAEYDWVPVDVFRERRGDFLRSMLNRSLKGGGIYSSDMARAELEQQARENLQQLLDVYENAAQPRLP